MSGAWETKTLEELCDFKNGLWKGKKPPYVHVGIIRNTNFTKDGRLDDSEIAYHDVEVKQFEKRRLQVGDLVLEKSGGGPNQPIGRVIPFEKSEGDFSFSNFTSVIRIRNRRELNFRFLHRCLMHFYSMGITEKMQRRSTGIRNLDFASYKQLQIPLPPLPEQRRIVAILDEAFAAIDRAKEIAEQNAANARELFESYLNRVFSEKGEGWEERPLGARNDSKVGMSEPSGMAPLPEVVRFSGGGTPSKNNGDYWNGGIPWVSPKDMKSKEIYSSIDTITVSGAENSSARLIPSGAILLVVRSGILARTIPVAIARVQLATNQDLKALIPDTARLASEYLYYFLCSKESLLLGRVTRGATVHRISTADIRSLQIPLPPLPEQRRIVAILDELSSATQTLIQAQSTRLLALDDLRQSILAKAFTGQLTAKSPELEAIP